MEVGGISVDWCKNARGNDHGALFQAADIQRFPSDQINYQYYQESGEDPADVDEGFCRPLDRLRPRLELLGFTMAAGDREYDALRERYKEERESLGDLPGGAGAEETWTFRQFCEFAAAHPIDGLDDTFIEYGSPDEDARRAGRFANERLIADLPQSIYDRDAYSERSHFGSLINVLHPYSVLRVLAESPANEAVTVTWQYGPLVNAGWATKDEFVPGASDGYVYHCNRGKLGHIRPSARILPPAA